MPDGRHGGRGYGYAGTESAMTDDIADLISESLIVRDMRGHITLWNRASERLYGLLAVAALGQKLHDLLGTRYLFPMADIEARLLAAGIWEGEVGRRASDGRQLSIEVRWTLRRDAGGLPVDIVETGRDISALNTLEQETRLAAHRYRNLFQAMAAAFWEMDFSRVRIMIGSLMASAVTDLPRYMAENPDWVVEAMRAVLVVDVNDKVISLFGATQREEIVGGHVAWCFAPQSRHVFAESLFRSVGLDAMAHESVRCFLDTPRPDVPGCFLLDVRMPGIGGLEFQAQLQGLGIWPARAWRYSHVRAGHEGGYRGFPAKALSRPGPAGCGRPSAFPL